MGKLRQRIDDRDKLRKEVEREEQYFQEFAKSADSFSTHEWYDNESQRSPELKNKRNLRRVIAFEEKARQRIERLNDAFDYEGLTPAEIENRQWIEEVDDLLFYTVREDQVLAEIPLPLHARLRDLREDLRSNFMYDDWAQQLLNKHHAVQTYAGWCLYRATKSVLKLISSYPGGRELLVALQPVGSPVPTKEDVLTVKINPAYDSTDPEEFLSFVWHELPGTWNCAQILLTEYCDAVRAERERARRAKEVEVWGEDTPLPDDPEEGEYIMRYELPEEIRFKRAVEDYCAGAGSYRQIAKEYGLPRDRFLAQLHELGVVRDAGRPAA